MGVREQKKKVRGRKECRPDPPAQRQGYSQKCTEKMCQSAPILSVLTWLTKRRASSQLLDEAGKATSTKLSSEKKKKTPGL